LKWFHGLTKAQKAARGKKWRQLLAWHAVDNIIISDEKLFVLQDTQPIEWPGLFCFDENYFTINISWETVPKCIQKKARKGFKFNQDYYIEYVLERHLSEHAKNL
jgi:hypothetical protein